MGEILKALSNEYNHCTNLLRVIKQFPLEWANYSDDNGSFSKWIRQYVTKLNNDLEYRHGASREINDFIGFANYAYSKANDSTKEVFNLIADCAVRLYLSAVDLFEDALKTQLKNHLGKGDIIHEDYDSLIRLFTLGHISKESFIKQSLDRREQDLIKLTTKGNNELVSVFTEIVSTRGWTDKITGADLYNRRLLPHNIYWRLLDDDALAQLFFSEKIINKETLKSILSERQSWDGSWTYGKELFVKRIINKAPIDSLCYYCGNKESVLLDELFSIKNPKLQQQLCFCLIDRLHNDKQFSHLPTNIWARLISHISLPEPPDSYDETQNSNIKRLFVDKDYLSIIKLFYSDRESLLAFLSAAKANHESILNRVKQEFQDIYWDHYISESDLQAHIPSYRSLLDSESFFKKLMISTTINFDLHSQKDSRNQSYMSYVKANAKDLLGTYFPDFDQLSSEQQDAVLTDEDNTLVIASAGSGKTHVLLSKFDYLTIVKGVDRNRIKILSYNKKIADKTNELLNKRNGIPERERQSMTFHALANQFSTKRIRDVISNNRTKREDHDARVYDILNAVKNPDVFDHLYDHLINYGCVVKYEKEIRFYLSYYRDRNGVQGNLNSYEERIIFDFLVENGVSFVYEEYDPDTKTKVDFTIYRNDGSKVYYEHAAIRYDNTSPFKDYVKIFEKKKKDHKDKGGH